MKNAGETTVANFTLAVDKSRGKNKDHPEANWVDCVAWGKTAEFLAKYFFKGNRVGITGSLQTRTYENKDGVKVKVTEILVGTVDFVESKSDAQKTKENLENNNIDSETENSNNSVVVDSVGEDDVPF